MKKYIFIILFSLPIHVSLHASNKGLARVKKILGVEVYIYSEPIRDYQVVGDVNSYSWGQASNDIAIINKQLQGTDRSSDVSCPSMSDKIKSIVKNGLKKKMAKKKPIDFDAIIIDDDEGGVLIKFISDDNDIEK